MMCLGSYLVVAIFATGSYCDACKLIKIFSNFEDDDKTFFKTTYPSIVGNIGADLNVKYYFLDNGYLSGRRMCVLEDLRDNIYLQAEYLKCEAGDEKQDCIDKLPIDKKAFDRCLKRNAIKLFKKAQVEFKKTKAKKTPLIVLGNRKEIQVLKTTDLLKEICVIFGRNRPEQCDKPAIENSTENPDNKPDDKPDKGSGEKPDDDPEKKQDEKPDVKSDEKLDEKSDEKPADEKLAHETLGLLV